MKKIIFAVIALFVWATGASAQIYNPVKWTVATKKVSNQEAILYFKATIQDGWHIYSQTVSNGPIPTSFTFAASKDFSLVGKAVEPKPATKYEEVFKTNVGYFSKEVIFQQKIKIHKGTPIVKGTIEFMACDKSQCLPPDEYAFSVTIK